MSRPWKTLPIHDNGEPIIRIPSSLHCLEPHPYLSLGAPYGSSMNPWQLREGVVERLLIAQGCLNKEEPSLRLAIYDAWRPNSVQAYMVDHAISQLCISRGIDSNIDSQSEALMEVVAEVEQFWAPPSLDPCTPPPHSTGAAVDLTLTTNDLLPLDMGCEIDSIGPVSYPNHFGTSAMKDDLCRIFHNRRKLLFRVMTTAGFVQHPKEWWHFSYGDQLWAWKSKASHALYGSFVPETTNDITA